MTLEYEDLKIEASYKVCDATWDSPEEWDTTEIEVCFSYDADDEAVEQFIIEKITGREVDQISDREHDILLEYVDDHFDDLTDEFYEELLDYFEEDAREEAEKQPLSYYRSDDYGYEY